MLLAVLLSGCDRAKEYPVPLRVDTKPVIDGELSSLTVPVTYSLDELQVALERGIPTRLWAIDQQQAKCVPAQRVKVLKLKLKVSPDLGCRIVGEVRRGAIRLSGKGSRLTMDMPISARVSARNVGGFLKGETATGKAVVRARISFSIKPDWSARAAVRIDYDWKEPAGIDFLGKRIQFASKLDPKLAQLIASIENKLQAEVAKAPVRQAVAEAWRHGFTVFELNREKPPAWMRVSPKSVGLVSYAVERRTIRFIISASALTETFVGSRPDKPTPTPLPPPDVPSRQPGLQVSIPVLAEYSQIEPVILRALRKLAVRGIPLKDVGEVKADFQKVTVHATEHGRIAVGIDVAAEVVGQRTGKSLAQTRGRVWLTGLPRHAPNSQLIFIDDLKIYGKTENLTGDIVVQLMGSDNVRQKIASSITQNFAKDYDKVLKAARKAIARRQEGRLLITARIDSVEHGLIKPTGEGLFLAVRAKGAGNISLLGKRRRDGR